MKPITFGIPRRGNASAMRSVVERAAVAKRSTSILLAVALVIGMAGVGLVGVTASQQATPAATSGHPLVGTWIIDPEIENPANPPSFDAFMADGTLVNIGSDGASVGSWEATGPRTAAFTFAGIVAGSGDAAAFIIRGTLEVDETGEALTGLHSFTMVAADGVILASAEGGGAGGTRFHTEPMDMAGQTLQGFPTWTLSAPEAATPTS
jgi:hypothetical protein